MATESYQKRSKKLVRPGVQLRLCAAFFCCAALAVVLQATVLFYSLSELATSLPSARIAISERIPGIVSASVLISFAFLAPLMLIVGVLVTFRIVGPLQRFEDFLERIVRGEKPEDCQLRRTDDLHELCSLLNRATAPTRTRGAEDDVAA